MTLNEKSYSLLTELEGKKGVETLEFNTSFGKVTILDVGVNSKVSKEELGVKVAEATMGGLGKVKISEGKLHVKIPEKVAIATLGCQLAGWSIKIGEKNVLGSGPARLLAKKPRDLAEKIGYQEESQKAALILEADFLPSQEICEKILKETKAKELIIAAFKGNSKVGMINTLARAVEVGVFRLEHLGYDVSKIKHGEGEVPLSQPGMFPTNDAIIYQSKVLFKVQGWNPELTPKTVSQSSKVYGKSFQEIFEEAGQDFYKIPEDIFAPAQIRIIDLKDNREYKAGKIKQPPTKVGGMSENQRFSTQTRFGESC